MFQLLMIPAWAVPAAPSSPKAVANSNFSAFIFVPHYEFGLLEKIRSSYALVNMHRNMHANWPNRGLKL
jgi:hypothetical protein